MTSKFLFSFSSILSYLIISNAFSQVPQITQISGSIENGSIVIINGQNLGSHPDFNPNQEYLCYMWDNFENGTFASGWGYNSSYAIVINSNNRPNSSHNMRGLCPQGSMWTFAPNGSNYRKVYMYAYRNFHDFSTVTVTNRKSWRVYSENFPADGDWVCVINGPTGWQNGNFFWIFELGDYSNHSGSFGPGFLDSWHCYEVWVDAIEENVKITYDGNIVSNTWPNSGNYSAWNAHRVSFDAYSHESSPTAFTYTDDAFIDYTQARVMIGNSPNFANATHREIQIPLDWSTSQISVRFNQGSYSLGENVYIFVVDENGNYSTGTQIQIGQPSVSKPTGLLVEP